MSVDDYFLLVESLDTEVVAFAPMLASHHPRVIAVGEGNGDLLRVNLLLSEQCRLRRSLPLSKVRHIVIQFTAALYCHVPMAVRPVVQVRITYLVPVKTESRTFG